MKVLVVGGAGYIGSHCVRQLEEAGHVPVILDNLVFGHRGAVAGHLKFYQEDLGDRARVLQILKDEQIELVKRWIASGAKFDGEEANQPLSLVIPGCRREQVRLLLHLRQLRDS